MVETLSGGTDLEQDDSGAHQDDPGDAAGVQALAEQPGAGKDGAGRSDPRPDRVGGADRQDFQRAAQQIDEGDEQEDRQAGLARTCMACGHLHRDGPTDVQKPGDGEHRPSSGAGHGDTCP
jgi:hypothetical protein